MAGRRLPPGLLALALVLVMGMGHCLAGQAVGSAKPESCDGMQARFRALGERLAKVSDTVQRNSLLEFLDSVPDDPEDCVTRAAQQKLSDVEGHMIQLDMGSGLVSPDWLYQCSKIDVGQRCLGGTPYQDETPRNTNEEIRQGHAMVLSNETATIAIAPGMACRVLTVWAAELQTLHPADPARIILAHGAAFPLGRLRRMRAPVVVASLRCDDSLRFRKAAWLLLPERPGVGRPPAPKE